MGEQVSISCPKRQRIAGAVAEAGAYQLRVYIALHLQPCEEESHCLAATCTYAPAWHGK